MKIQSVTFHKSVELSRDNSKVKIVNGQELRGPDFPDGALVQLEFLEGKIAYLLRNKQGQPISAKLFPAGENVEQIVVDPEQLAKVLEAKSKR